MVYFYLIEIDLLSGAENPLFCWGENNRVGGLNLG